MVRSPSALATLTLVLALGHPVAGQTGDKIEGTSWRLIEISKLDVAELDRSPRAIARFDSGRLRGFIAKRIREDVDIDDILADALREDPRGAPRAQGR